MLPPDIEESIKQFLHDVKKEQIKHLDEISCETVKLLQKVVTNCEWETAKDLMDIIRNIGKRLIDEHPIHVVIGNMVKRVLKIIRDEYSSAIGKDNEYEQQESLQKILVAEEQMDFAKVLETLKKSIAASLRELLEEVENSQQNIAMQALEHIQSGDRIITFGFSRTVEKFIKRAASKRKFEVVVCQQDTRLSGKILKDNLVECGIEATLIPDSHIAVFGPICTKAIIGTNCVTANGGVRSTPGTSLLALVAKRDSVPFIVLAPMFKLAPWYVSSCDQDGFNYWLGPEELIPYEDDILSQANVIVPAFDLINPEYISLIISNVGSTVPAQMYRWLSEHYHRDDYDL